MSLASTFNPSRLHTTVGLAPMEGVTSFPARLFFHLTSAPKTQGTPFLRVTPTYPHREIPATFAPELDLVRGLLPYTLVPQMMAAETDDFLRAVDYFDPAQSLELNAGCPSPTCVGKGAGSSLLLDVDDFHRMIERLTERLGSGRFALKMRTGFRDASEFPGLLRGLALLPLERLTVHGRTRPDGYRGQARWDLIQQAAMSTHAPVVASGDVVDLASLHALAAAAPNIASAVVGRGALRNPWIFEELRCGDGVVVSARVLTLSLAVFASLQDLQAERFDTLIALVRDGVFSKTCGTNAEEWERVARRLAVTSYGSDQHLDDAPTSTTYPAQLSRNTLGRTKMLWNYLRSSLPDRFFEPTVLRHRELGALLAHVKLLCSDDSVDARAIPLKHNAARDWLYSGARKETTETDAAGPSRDTSSRVHAASQTSTSDDNTMSSTPPVRG